MADDRRKSLQSSPTRGRRTGRQSGHESHKRGLNTKIHLAVDAHGMPLRVIITEGTAADCTQACQLVAGIESEHLIADRGYDTDVIVNQALESGINPIIPPRKNRKI